MRLFLPVAIVLVMSPAINSQQQKNKPQKPQQTAATDQRGTQESPVVVKVLPTTKTSEETEQESKDRKDKTANDRNLVYFTGVLAAVGFLQLIVFGYQASKLRETVKSAGEQAEAMERHIGEAARSATAMEDISTKIQEGNKAILRAYLTVTVGDIHLFQERKGPGQIDLKFEARPNLTNTGNTPARNVGIRVAANILPIPIPNDFQYPLPRGEIKNAGIVGAHEKMILAGTVDDFVPDAEIGTIKEGRVKALCVWGLITYNDIFGMNHYTKFGQWITWNPNGVVVGYYIAGQNDSD